MDFLDSHTHIYLTEFDADRPTMIDRSVAQGVEKLLLPAIDSETHAKQLQVESAFPDRCISMMGLHPCSAKDNVEEELRIVRQYLDQRSFIAIGEIGLDLYWDKDHLDQQYLAFERQIQWALELDLPIVIHSREATERCIEVVRKHQNGKLRGVFHCYSGSVESARQIIDLGFYLGIGGVVTYKNAGLPAVIAQLSLDHLLLETDAPYLTPVPHRGKRNEPAYIPLVAQKIAEAKFCSVQEVAEKTTANAKALFRLG
ncbi:MAG: TatD family hydrolase [Bacteroidota bacterium]